jgi:hypothetical protein
MTEPTEQPVTFADATVATVEGFIPHRLTGYDLRDTSGGGAVVRIRDGAAGGKIIATISLLPSESDHEGSWNRVTASGCYMQLVSGTVEGSIFVRP